MHLLHHQHLHHLHLHHMQLINLISFTIQEILYLRVNGLKRLNRLNILNLEKCLV